MGFSREKTTLPAHRGERIAAWVALYIKTQRCSVAELSFRISQDRRDLQRLLDTKSCGHRLEDALAAHFGWPFVRAVMAPVIESSIEAEIAREKAEIAAREERLARLYRAREDGRPAPRLVNPKGRPGPASRGIGA